MTAVPVNYWAVLVCGVASMVLGYLWYGPLFGKMYMKLMGWENVDPAKREEMMKGMTKSYILAFIGALVMAWVLAHAIIFSGSYMHSKALNTGLITGFMSWLGFVAPVTMSNVLWGNQSWKLWFLGNGYYLVQLLMFGAILGSWVK